MIRTLSKIDRNGIIKIVNEILKSEEVQFYELYSEENCPIVKISTIHEFEVYLNNALFHEFKTLKFAIHYPQANFEFKISDNEVFSKYSAVPVFRKLIEGPGLIYFTIFRNEDLSMEYSIQNKSKEKKTSMESSNYTNCNWDFIEQETQKLLAII